MLVYSEATSKNMRAEQSTDKQKRPTYQRQWVSCGRKGRLTNKAARSININQDHGRTG